MHLYNALVKSVLQYGAKTWTILKSDEQKLEAFHMFCQWRILSIRWYNFVTNADMVDSTHQESLEEQIQRRQLAVFGYVHRIPYTTPAHTALRLSTDARPGRRVDGRPGWKQLRRRPRNTWTPGGARPWNSSRQCVERCDRSWCLEGAMTHSRSCSPVNDWNTSWHVTKNRPGAGSANSGANYIPVLTPDAAYQPAASIARPTASLPLCPRNYGRGLVIYA